MQRKKSATLHYNVTTHEIENFIRINPEEAEQKFMNALKTYDTLLVNKFLLASNFEVQLHHVQTADNYYEKVGVKKSSLDILETAETNFRQVMHAYHVQKTGNEHAQFRLFQQPEKMNTESLTNEEHVFKKPFPKP